MLINFKMPRGWLSILAAAALLMGSGCVSKPESSSTVLTVMAAASLNESFTELGRLFEASHPNAQVVFNFAGSQQLAQQLAHGAPADVFASANVTQMNLVVESGRVEDGASRIFARSRLVVVSSLLAEPPVATLQDLARPGLKLVFAAPQVPVGGYTLGFLDKASQVSGFGADYKEKVLANVVSYEDNVRAVLTKVSLGEADAGVVYTSDVKATDTSVRRLEIPDALNAAVEYPIAVLNDSLNSEMAQTFVEWVLSVEGQRVLQAYGFLTKESQ